MNPLPPEPRSTAYELEDPVCLGFGRSTRSGLEWEFVYAEGAYWQRRHPHVVNGVWYTSRKSHLEGDNWVDITLKVIFG